MKFDLSDLDFSKNDVRLNIKIPEILDKRLAYLLGIQVGDGFLKKIIRKGKIDYLISYDGHKINEFEWYNHTLKPLIKYLFNKDVKVRKTTTGTVKIYFGSKAVFIFLHEVCGVSQSPKHNIIIPSIITNSNKEIKRSFLRGLADTDFSLNFKKRTEKAFYPVIDFNTSCITLHKSTKKLLEELGFRISFGHRKKPRRNKMFDSYYIRISGRDQLDKWMKEVCFESSNHLTRYLVWKKLGHLPQNTDIIQRYKILKENEG